MNGKTNVTTGPGSDELLQVPLEAPTSFTADAGNSQVTLKWTDPIDKYAVVLGDTAETSDQLVSEFDHTIVVRKEGSNPTDPSDGTLVTTSSSRNQYQTSGYIDAGLTNDIEYHYGIYTANKANIFSPGAFAHATPMGYRPASTFPVGNVFKIPVNGTVYNWTIVNQGNPDTSKYNASCNGTWLLMEDCYTSMKFFTGNSGGINTNKTGNYNISDVKSYLDNDFFNMLNDSTKKVVKQVTLPTASKLGFDPNWESTTISAKAFILSLAELGFYELPQDESANLPTTRGINEGAVLNYFLNTNRSGADPKRKSKQGKTYWTRTPLGSNTMVYTIINTGDRDAGNDRTDSFGVRVCMIIDSNAMFNDNGELLIE